MTRLRVPEAVRLAFISSERDACLSPFRIAPFAHTIRGAVTLEPGMRIAGHYEVVTSLARGGMGDVLEAARTSDGVRVAIKTLRPELRPLPDSIERFRREAIAAQKIRSPHVVEVLEVLDDPQHGPLIVFELLNGETLADLLKRQPYVPVAQAEPIARQILTALVHAHAVDIVHRDLKPSNVILHTRPDGLMQVKVLDFGVSKLPVKAGMQVLTRVGQNLGTFQYMAPEQIGAPSEVDGRADLYACGVLVYRMLTGQLPYRGRGVAAQVSAKRTQPARSLNEARPPDALPFSPGLEAFVAKMLERTPQARFQTAREALEAWEKLATGGRIAEGSGLLP